MKRVWLAGWMLTLLGVLPLQVQAADFEMQNTFEDAIYGAGIGLLVGGGLMLISGNPGDHWDYLAVGAGVGVIAGTLYGVATSTRALAEIDDDGVKLAMPTPQWKTEHSQGKTSLAMEMDLLKTSF